MNIQFAHPDYLWFLLIIVPCVAWYIYTSRTRYASVAVSSLSPFNKQKRSIKQYLLYALFGFRMLCIAALIVILARPQSSSRWSDSTQKALTLSCRLISHQVCLPGISIPTALKRQKRLPQDLYPEDPMIISALLYSHLKVSLPCQ